MTVKEFIDELRDALLGELPENEIRSNIEYYENYLYVKAKTSSEESAVAALGNPNLIAKSLINNYRMTHPNETHYDNKGSYTGDYSSTRDTYYGYQNYSSTNDNSADGYNQTEKNKRKVFNLNSSMIKVLAVIVPIILVLLFLFLSRMIFRYFIPIVVIVIIIYVIKGAFKK